MINSLTDVINELELDVYKRCSLEDLRETEKEIDPKVYKKVNEECTKLVNKIPFVTYINQPKNRKFFLPPIPELLEELGTSLSDEVVGRAFEEDKKQNEEVNCFYCGEGLLILVTTTKENNKVYYTYNYDYEERHSVLLMSRVEYSI